MAQIHLMLDSESWGLSAGAVVRQIAVTPFIIKTEWVGSPLDWYPNQQMQLSVGRVREPETVAWWDSDKVDEVTRSRVNRAEEANRNPVGDVLIGLRNWILNYGPNARIFARNVAHDKPMLESLYRSFGFEIPWRYDVWRDVYCYADGLGVDIRNDPALQQNIEIRHEQMNVKRLKHEAVSDTLVQIECVLAGLRKYNITEIY